jgi:hypothetical protein
MLPYLITRNKISLCLNAKVNATDTELRHWTRSWAPTSTHSLTPSRRMSLRHILILYYNLLSLRGFLSLGFPTKIIYRFLSPPYLYVVTSFPPWRPGFDPRSDHMGFLLNNVTFGRAFSEYFGLPCQFSFHQTLHIHNNPIIDAV